uniref:Uncharacterized protein n=1 Tax=Echinococcus canadensis TaxID=519352 RepID=A0A915EZ37_9CEST
MRINSLLHPEPLQWMGTGSDGAAICSTSASLQLAQVLPQAFKKQNRVRHWALRTNLTLEQFLFAAIKGNLVSNPPINQKNWHYQPIHYTK